ncbi:MAG: hypothetical protein H0V68_01575 [Actinobacteria bacterium]|nr:hypothetical protein [Actinomycetota bacterium]
MHSAFSRDSEVSAPARGALGASLFVYTGVFAAAQILVATGSPVLGAAIAAILVLVLANHSIHARRPSDQAAYAGLALVPLVVLVRQVLAVGIGTPEPEHVVWAVTLVLAASLAMRRLGGSSTQPRTLAGDWSAGAVIVVSGPAFGLGAYAVAFSAAGTDSIAISQEAAALLLVSVAAEEVLFRGAVQRALTRAAGQRGMALTVLLFVLAYLNFEPHGYAAVVAAAGTAFSLAVASNAPLIAVVGARVLMTVTIISLLPRLPT